MDFVVFGFGVGALLMLGGFALRDLGPWLFGSARADAGFPEFEAAKATIRKQALASVGNALSVGGLGVAAITVAALLARAADNIGTTVVGVGLVLSALGVGAWSFDTYRRYQAAMGIVTAQESSVRARIQARNARDRALRPESNAPEPAPSTPAAKPEVPKESQPEVEAEAIEADDPLPTWTHRRIESKPGAAAKKSEPAKPVAPAIPPASKREPDRTPPKTDSVVRETRAASRNGSTPPNADSLVRETPAANRGGGTPSVKNPGEDALIDESIRVEAISPIPRPSAAPAWLFDDLETDLEQQGSDQADPIDAFQDAKPLARQSALERLLAEDLAKRQKPGGDGSDR